MQPTRTVCVTALLTALLLASRAGGDDAAKPAAPAAPAASKPKPANPLAQKPANPLLDDPFVGQFEGGGMVLILRPAAGGNGYEGEIRKRGQTFTVKATLKGEELVGVFVFDEFTYEFKGSLDQQALKFTTEDRTFSLQRKDQAGDASVPAISKTLPALPPAPNPPPKPPADLPVKPAAPPANARLTPAPPVQRLDYARMNTQQLRQACWTRFPAGTVLVLEDIAITPTVVPVTERTSVVYSGIVDGKAALKAHAWDGARWTPWSQPITAPTEDAIRIDDMGFTKGETTSENLVIGPATVICDRMAYTGEIDVKGAPMRVSVLVWRGRGIDIPTLVMDLPEKRLLLEPDMVKVQAEIDYRGVKVAMGLQLDAMEQDGRVGRQSVKYAVVTGKSMIESGGTKIHRTSENWISHQVPGGVMKTTEAEKRGRAVTERLTQLVDFASGQDVERIAKPAAATP